MRQIQMTVSEGLQVVIVPNETHEYLMTTKEVAQGYGVSEYAVRMNKSNHSSELIEGKHFVTGATLNPKGVKNIYTLGENAQPHQVFWTKRGIVRLGFFIKSERAKLFRDWAEDLIIAVDSQRDLFGNVVVSPQKQLPQRRRHNRLTSHRLNEIMREVCKIEDNALRLSITEKLYQNY